jgi:5-methylcytosine-specific restriction endonuclease McrA
MRNVIKNYPNDKFIEIFNNSNSISQIIRAFRLNVCGAQYKAVQEKCKLLNLDISKFDKTKWLSSAHQAAGIPLSQILVQNSTYTSLFRLKKRILKELKIEYKCEVCGLKDWLDKPISLQLDHKNGINNDHRLENLRFICPNCHSQSSTYAGRNKRKWHPA